jgi:hypothetical protein
VTAAGTEQIARVCHAAISELQQVYEDSCPSVPWDSADEESRRSTFASVEAVLAGADAEELHAEWARGKAAEGWRRGPLKDAEARTHPALVPFADLPASEQVKDVVFAAVVRAMAGGGEDAGTLLGRALAAERKVAEYESAVNWMTECLACAAVLDAAISETFRRETAEERITRALDVTGNFLAQYGESEIPVFKAGIDLSNSVRKILDPPETKASGD